MATPPKALLTQLHQKFSVSHGDIYQRLPAAANQRLVRREQGFEGRLTESHSRDAIASELCFTNGKKAASLKQKGRRSADRRIHQVSAPHSQTLPPESASGAAARHTSRCCHLKVLRARSPLGAPAAALAKFLRLGSAPGPRFMESERA